MILQSLVDYYEALAGRDEIVWPGWCYESIHFALNISLDGELLDLIPLTEQVQVGKKLVDLPQTMEVPEREVRSVGIKPNFLCDNITYIFGFDDKGKPARSIDCFKACKELHTKVLEGVSCDAGKAIYAFFANWQPEKAREHPVIAPLMAKLKTANLVFMLNGGDYAHDNLEIKTAWREYRESESGDAQLRCMITGKTAIGAGLHGKIKGIPGAQSAGASLVSFNASAYESYGKDNVKASNAPISKYAAFAYVTALNKLISDREHKQQIGDATTVYWAEDGDLKVQQLFTSAFKIPGPDDSIKLRGAMENLAKGLPVADVDMEKQFYILGLAPNAARISVRFFLRDSFGAFLNNLKEHYERLEIVKPAFDHREFLTITALLEETANPKSRDKIASPLLHGAVTRAILEGTAYPAALFQAVLVRIRAEREVTRGKAAIIKAYLLKENKTDREVLTVALNESSNNKAYVLGRLFSVLEDAQLQANPGINATIKDRYFTSACTTPGNVFPTLLRLANHHIAKAEYGKNREIEITGLMGKLKIDEEPFPKNLSMNEQGNFILGYYQQTQARYTKKQEVE